MCGLMQPLPHLPHLLRRCGWERRTLSTGAPKRQAHLQCQIGWGVSESSPWRPKRALPGLLNGSPMLPLKQCRAIWDVHWQLRSLRSWKLCYPAGLEEDSPRRLVQTCGVLFLWGLLLLQPHRCSHPLAKSVPASVFSSLIQLGSTYKASLKLKAGGSLQQRLSWQ